MMESILNKKRYRYLKENFGFIVYGNNGKATVISKILPRFAYDVIRKVPEKLALFIILDEDGTPLSQTLTQICKSIKAKKIPHVNVVCRDTIYLFSEVDNRYSIELKIFLIPISLEKNLVNTAIEHVKITQKQKEKVLREDPHEALQQLSQLFEISKNDLIRKSVEKDWFNKSPWFIKLISELKDFFERDE